LKQAKDESMLIDSGKSKRWANLRLKLQSLRGGDGLFIARGSVLVSPLRVGRGTRFNGPTYMRGTGGVELGNFCAIGHFARFVTSNHGTGHANMQFQLGRSLGIGPQRETSNSISIGNNVWIGDSVIFLPGVKVGNGAVIGAGSIVTGDVERYAVYAGNPARKIRDRFDESVKDALDRASWWDWSASRMRRSRALFDADLDQMPSADAVNLIQGVSSRSACNDA
jgi:virginiamycin A acetyltransferase